MQTVSHTPLPDKPEADGPGSWMEMSEIGETVQIQASLTELDGLIQLRLQEAVNQVESVFLKAFAEQNLQERSGSRTSPKALAEVKPREISRDGAGSLKGTALQEEPPEPLELSKRCKPTAISDRINETRLEEHEHERISEPCPHPVRRSWRSKLEVITEGTGFSAFFVFLISINAIVMGVETQAAADNIGRDVDPPIGFTIIGIIFSVLFILELSLRTVALGPKRAFCGQTAFWQWFDLFLVLISLPSMVLDIFVLMGTDTVRMSGLSNLRVFRLFKAARLIKVLRYPFLQRWLRSLLVIFVSIASTIKSLVWTFLLLILIMIFFAILFVQAAVDTINENGLEVIQAESPQLLEFWPNVPQAVVTLFMAVTGGIDYYDCALPLRKSSPLLEQLFLIYIFFTHFCMFNVVTGVFCNSAIESASHDPELVASGLNQQTRALKIQLEKVFDELDADNSGRISHSELEVALESPTVLGYFEAVGLGLAEAEEIFRLVDASGDGWVTISEFVEGCLKLKGGSTGVDIALVRDDVATILQKLKVVEQQITLLPYRQSSTNTG